MFSFAKVFAFVACAVDSISAISTSQVGKHDGYYYSFTNEGSLNPINYENLPGSEYSLTWGLGDGGYVIGGKGWNPGSDNRVVNYSGTYDANGNSVLALYGWTHNPLVEYYVVEYYNTLTPLAGAKRVGTVTTDGSIYDLGHFTQIQKPSIEGTQTYMQFWAVRRFRRKSGTITFSNIVNAWRQAGLNFGSTHNYQIMAVNGYYCSGNAQIKVDIGNNAASPDPPTTTLSAGTVPMFGQCGGKYYSGDKSCAKGSCTYFTDWYSMCM